MVCLGVALRCPRRVVGSCCWAERSRLSHRRDHRSDIFVELWFASPARCKLSRGSWPGTPGRIGSHDPLPGAPSCCELVVRCVVVLDSRILPEEATRLLRRSWPGLAFVAHSAPDTGVGKYSWRISAGPRPSWDLLAQRCLGLFPAEG